MRGNRLVRYCRQGGKAGKPGGKPLPRARQTFIRLLPLADDKTPEKIKI